MADQARPVSGWRRYLRFSVRGLLLLVLLIGGWLGWLAQTARTQREAVAAVLKVHGAIRYDWQGASFASGEPAPPMATRWLARTIGQDYLHSVSDCFNKRIRFLEKRAQRLPRCRKSAGQSQRG